MGFGFEVKIFWCLRAKQNNKKQMEQLIEAKDKGQNAVATAVGHLLSLLTQAFCAFAWNTEWESKPEPERKSMF